MSKELEAFKRICDGIDYAENHDFYKVGDIELVENALKRLDEIDNRPTVFVVSNRNMENAIIKEISKHKEIKITNLADQKKLKAFDIIKAHKLLNYVIKNAKCAAMYRLSSEEIRKLKEVVE